MNLGELVRQVAGTLEGSDAIDISGVAGLKEAQPGEVSFLANPKYGAAMAGTKASAVIVSRDWKGECSCSLVRVDNPDQAFAKVAVLLTPPPIKPVPGIHPTAVIAKDVVLGERVTIGPWCVLEPGSRVGAGTCLHAGCYLGHGATIGADGLFYPHVSIREYSRIGDRVIVHSGAVIGSDGFGYAQDQGRWAKIPQIGSVEIGNDVEIGANVTIDRARFGKTVLADGVKVDNLVQIAHNVRIGEHTAMAAQVGISGSTIVGRNVQLGGQAGVAGHLSIGDGAIIGAQAGVTKDVDAGTFVSGYPAMLHARAKRLHAHYTKLPEVRDKLWDMEKRLAALEKAAGKVT